MAASSHHDMALVQATRFAAAIERNDVKITKRLLAGGANVNTRCPDPKDLQTSWSALLRAAYLGHFNIVNLLLAAGARNDLRLQYDQVIQSDSKYGNDLNVELSSATALYIATARHHEHGNGLKIVRALLKYQADPNACNALSSTPLMAAAEHGGGHVMLRGKQLRDVDENETDTTNIVLVLLRGGADPTRRDRNGWTALLLSCYLGNLQEVKILLEFTTPNFSRNDCDYGEERLQDIASEKVARDKLNILPLKNDHSHSDNSMIELKNKGLFMSTIVDDRDENGRTSLMLACQQKNPDVARILIKHGANIDAETPSNGWTSLMFCLVNGSNECVEILIQNGVSLGVQKFPSTGIKRNYTNKKSLPETTEMKKDTQLFPRDNRTGWTPAMLGAHHCISVQHAFTLRLVLEAGGPVNPELFNADSIAFPNETRTAIDLASARGHSAALRLFADAETRWKEFQTFLTGRSPLPTLNENLKKYKLKHHPTQKDHEELKQEERAKKERERRREERYNRRRDAAEEQALKLKREGTSSNRKEQVDALMHDWKDMHQGGEKTLSPIHTGKNKNKRDITKENKKRREKANKDKMVEKRAVETWKQVHGRKATRAMSAQDLEEQLQEALKEVARLHLVVDDTRNERDHWRATCKQREDEISEYRMMASRERKKTYQYDHGD